MKNKLFKQLLIAVLTCVLIVLFISYAIFKPSFIDVFDFSTEDKSRVSSVINNLFTPVISLVSVILLYITLNKQIQSITDQRLSKNLDLILTLITNLDNEYLALTYNKKGTKSKGNVSTEYSEFYHGYDALTNYINIVKANPEKFGGRYFSEKVISIIYSFGLLIDTFNKIDIDDNIKTSLTIKIDNFYLMKLRYPLIQYAYFIKNNTDNHSIILLEYVLDRERRINDEFDLFSYKNEGELVSSILNS